MADNKYDLVKIVQVFNKSNIKTTQDLIAELTKAMGSKFHEDEWRTDIADYIVALYRKHRNNLKSEDHRGASGPLAEIFGPEVFGVMLCVPQDVRHEQHIMILATGIDDAYFQAIRSSLNEFTMEDVLTRMLDSASDHKWQDYACLTDAELSDLTQEIDSQLYVRTAGAYDISNMFESFSGFYGLPDLSKSRNAYELMAAYGFKLIMLIWEAQGLRDKFNFDKLSDVNEGLTAINREIFLTGDFIVGVSVSILPKTYNGMLHHLQPRSAK